MRIGIFGGAFDPLHNGHAELISGAKEELFLEKVLLIPSYNPPHKHTELAPYAARVEMLERFAATRKYIEVSHVERELALENSYAYLIIGALKEKYPHDELFYLIGGDSLMQFHTWKHPELVAKAVKIAVVNRGEMQGLEERATELNARYDTENICVLPFGCENVSSSRLKFYLASGDYAAAAHDVPSEIAEYIAAHGLYSGEVGLTALKANIPAPLFAHCARTAKYAVEHAWQINESFERAFLAGYFHDCAKSDAPLHSEYPTGSPQVIHQYDSAELAQKLYGISDEVILDAIRFHTTAKPDFSPLGKLLYIADKLEEGRHYEGVEELRAEVERDFEAGFLAVLKHGYEYLVSKNVALDVLTERAYLWYNGRK